MANAIRFPAEIEPLVHFVEETPSEQIVEQTVTRLREGTSPDRMMTALALAVVRSTEMPFVHHGGPLHPVAALHSIRGTMTRLPETGRLLPLVQDVALANAHIHDAISGPYLMPEIDPIGEGTVEATREAFFGCLRRNYTSAAEHYFLWLLDRAPRQVALEALVSVAVDNYRFDEHKLIAAVNSIRLLDHLGWDLAEVILRPVVRYNFMPSVWAKAAPAEDVERLMRDKQLDAAGAGKASGEQGFSSLSEDLLSAPLEEQTEVIAAGLSNGMSLADAAKGISLTASEVFVRGESTNPMGIHAMTGANALRWVCERFPEVGMKGLLLWPRGPETESGASLQPSSLSSDGSSLDAIREAIEENDSGRTVACTHDYCASGGDVADLARELGWWAARDGATEMHGVKHHQAMVEEYENGKAPVHLVAQAREASLHAHRDVEVSDRFTDRMRPGTN